MELDSLEIKVQSSSQEAASGLDKLAASLGNLKSAAKGGAGLSTLAKGLERINASLSNSAVSGSRIQSLVSALNGLSQIQKASGLNSVVNSLKKLPDISGSLDKLDLDKFASQIQRVAAAMKPLATEMEKVSNGFKAFPIRIQKIIQSNNALTSSNAKATRSFSLLNKGINLYIFQRVASIMSGWVTSANEYIENVNLFQVSMGEFYDEAFAYAQLVSDRLGIDPSEWMRNQGVFMSMANGFGLAREQAYALSEGLTELSYDLSSLYNENVEQSALRLQSALAGEIEPIRRLGISISQATLQEYALAHGIDESVTAMTEQEKALLRSLVLMEGASRVGAIGDFAKTLESPANAMRVLHQQITQLGRALGTVLLPIIVQIIPWVQAFVSVLTDAISALATFMGFTMPEWDTSDWGSNVSSGVSDIADSMGSATEAAKELKSATIGIDELNIISPQTGSAGSGGAGVSDWAQNLEVPEIWNKEAIAQIQTKASELEEKLKSILKVVLAIGAAFATWKISTGLAAGILGIQSGVKTISNALSLIAKSGPVQGALSKIGGLLASVAIQFNAAGGGIKGFLSVAKMITTAMAPAAAIFTVIISTLKVLVQRWEDIKNAIKTTLKDLGVEQKLESLRGALDALGERLGWTEGLWRGLTDTINWLMDIIGGTVITLVGSVLVGAFNALIEVLSGLISIVGGVYDVLSGICTFISGIFTGNLQKAADGIDLIGKGIQGVFGGLWNAVVGGVLEFVNGVLNAISSLGGALINEKLPAILNGFKDWWGGVVKFFKVGVPEWWDEYISPWFTVAKWKDLGNKALQGLFSGLSNIGSKIKTWGGNLVAGVKNFFGIHSPSTLFRDDIGINMGLGISEGLKNSKKTIMSEISKTYQTIRPAFSAPEYSHLFYSEQTSRAINDVTGYVSVSQQNDDANGMIINAIYAAAQQVIRAVEAGSDVYMDGYKVGERVTASQNRQNRVYGRTLQNV